MYYILIETADHTQMYQEVERGIVQRYCDLDGNTIPSPQEATWLVDANPTPPSWARPDNPEIPPVVYNIISRSDFRNKFTLAEKIALYTEAKQSVEAQILLDDVTNADQIDLAAAVTREKLMMLVPSGVLTEARVNEILNA